MAEQQPQEKPKAKRRAEYQVTRENGFPEDTEDQIVSFSSPPKASAEELAQRKIVRVKYKRPGAAKLAQANATLPKAEEAPAAKKNPFGGFSLTKKKTNPPPPSTATTSTTSTPSTSSTSSTTSTTTSAGSSATGGGSTGSPRTTLKKPAFSFARRGSTSSGGGSPEKEGAAAVEGKLGASGEVVDEHTEDAPKKFDFSFGKRKKGKFDFSKAFHSKSALFGAKAKAKPSVDEHLKSVFEKSKSGNVFGAQVTPPAAGKDSAVPLLSTRAAAKPKADLEGEAAKSGEEGETRVYEVKAKAFSFDAAKSEWAVRGLGQLRVNSNPAAKTARVIVRTQGTLRAVINVPIFNGMSVSRNSDKTLTIVSFDTDGEDASNPCPFLFKVGHKNSADQLEAKLKEVAASLPPKTTTTATATATTTTTTTATTEATEATTTSEATEAQPTTTTE